MNNIKNFFKKYGHYFVGLIVIILGVYLKNKGMTDVGTGLFGLSITATLLIQNAIDSYFNIQAKQNTVSKEATTSNLTETKQ